MHERPKQHHIFFLVVAAAFSTNTNCQFNSKSHSHWLQPGNFARNQSVSCCCCWCCWCRSKSCLLLTGSTNWSSFALRFESGQYRDRHKHRHTLAIAAKFNACFMPMATLESGARRLYPPTRYTQFWVSGWLKCIKFSITDTIFANLH